MQSRTNLTLQKEDPSANHDDFNHQLNHLDVYLSQNFQHLSYKNSEDSEKIQSCYEMLINSYYNDWPQDKNFIEKVFKIFSEANFLRALEQFKIDISSS